MPEEERYDGYLQLENGVGMLRLLENEFEEAYEKVDGDDRDRELSIATGFLAYPYIQKMASRIEEKYSNTQIHVYPIRNDFFGERITVSGLLTGQDIVAQLKDRDLGEAVLLPCNLLRSGEETLLDDMTVTELSDALQVPVNIVKSSGYDLTRNLMGIQTGGEYNE